MAQRKTTHRKVMTLDAPGYPRLEIIQHRKVTENGDEIVYVLNARPWRLPPLAALHRTTPGSALPPAPA